MLKSCAPPWFGACSGASHIVRCLDQGDPKLDATVSLMATDLVSGQDLNKFLLFDGLPANWNVNLLRKVIGQFVESLDFLRQKGFQHNDLFQHCGNVMVEGMSSNPVVRIIDFDSRRVCQLGQLG